MKLLKTHSWDILVDPTTSNAAHRAVDLRAGLRLSGAALSRALTGRSGKGIIVQGSS